MSKSSYRLKAEELGHQSERVLDAYDNVKITTSTYNNEEVAELDIIYFLKNILWSTDFELIAKTITDYGMESRLDQWKQAINKLNNK